MRCNAAHLGLYNSLKGKENIAVIVGCEGGFSPKEFDAVLRGVGGVDQLIDWNSKREEVTLMRYMDDPRTKEDKVYDAPELIKTPVVRNGKYVTVGYCPDIWGNWE